MHSFDYLPTLSMAVIYGGRNDLNINAPVLSDLWILKLYNLEYQKVQVGGDYLPVPRCSHVSLINGS
jgi:hypothetical protein